MFEDLRFGSIPMFAGVLAFLPACPGDNVTTQNDTSSSDTSGEATSAESGSSETTSATTDPPPSTTADTSGTTGDPVCVTCGSEPPEGWFGPVTYARVSRGQQVPECPPELPDQGPILVDGFVDPGPAICECSCEAPPAANCYAYMIGASNYGYGETGYAESGYYYGETGYNESGGGGSGGYGGTYGYGGSTYGYAESYGGSYGYEESGGGYCWGGYTQVNANCVNVEIDGEVAFQSYDKGYGGGGACMKNQVEEIPVTEWAETITTCRFAENAPQCDEGGICIPAAPEGFESKWCLYRAGDHECASPEFPNKSTFWSGVDDTRACTSCSCGGAGSTCDAAQLDVFAGPDCEGEPIATLDANAGCVDVVGGSIAPAAGGGATCPVTEESMPEGTVAPSGPFTFCCSD